MRGNDERLSNQLAIRIFADRKNLSLVYDRTMLMQYTKFRELFNV